ncbi:testis-expressed protein 36 isoform X2 [Anolis carolinensis]|uniref:Testis expressed 36 n=1 Tax=Anolis carolinensis TaxID=28377 RepID=G1KWI5_ANOCA|nr:PREDICTED: testis-expressed sequence 36 protein isoform X2 [Anolis carolinensis]XP_016847709.1 PREDICTED: testis-expressed sequence 36 protein isoform X2 [Anolis carolinensis]|eukprot:XP_003218639.1 PREDICTED: testis-expressed sequence 36 protein isoform X2 [Anolis carolinensis]
MPKGKRANPSTALDGIWFAHHGNLPLYPETLTAAMQKQILNPEATHQIDTRLPLMYKVREKKPGSTFPFSIHDNRHCLINVGEYLDSGLGLRKFQQETNQHHSNKFLFEAHQPIASSTGDRTIYQTSFVQYPSTKPPLVGRFPRSHVARSVLKPKDDKECMWFAKSYADSEFSDKPKKSPFSGPEQPLPPKQELDCAENSKELTT